MKRGLSFCIIFILLIGLAGSAGAHEEKDEAPEGRLFLTVSQLAMSVVGDTEDIYVGTIPRDRVTWESDDEKRVEQTAPKKVDKDAKSAIDYLNQGGLQE